MCHSGQSVIKSSFFKLLFPFFILGFHFSAQAEKESLFPGEYHFLSITDSFSGISLFEIDSSDFLIADETGAFHYELKAKSVIAQGAWDVIDDTLRLLYYEPQDTLRQYLMRFRTDTLHLHESGVVYSFVRKKESDLITQESVLPEKEDWHISALGKGALGLFVLMLMGYIFSNNRKNINWILVGKGLTIQIAFAFAILKISWVRDAFDAISRVFVKVLSFSKYGAEFLFGSLIQNTDSFGYIFAFQVLPTVIFFSALTSLLFYFGILQKVVMAFAWLMKHTFKLSGAESLSAAGNIFLGQTESPLLIKPYLERMTNSELLCVMSGGMATIAGGVLAAYIGFLGGADVASQVFFAKHLIAASVMSAPAAIISAKMLYPETEKFDESAEVTSDTMGTNALEAISNGTTDGLKLAINVGAMLLVFIAFIYMFNSFFRDVIGEYTGLNAWVVELSAGQYDGLSLQAILGYTLAPLTWLMGVAKEDMVLVGQLLGEKTILNEFVAYVSLGEMLEGAQFAQKKSVVIATYILCGFSNFASIGIQIGGIGALAPSRRSDLSRLGIRALIAGTMASLFTAVVVGMII
jgi:CNT family concentrative nucleoside transporter